MYKVSRALLTPDEAMRMKGAQKNAQGMITEPGNKDHRGPGPLNTEPE